MAVLFSVQVRDGRELPTHLDMLRSRLAAAPEQAPCEVPPDVVTMNSRVRVLDLERADSLEYELVFPHDADAGRGRVSVLTPVGAGLLGTRIGDVVEVPVPGAVRHLDIQAIPYQPEAAGHYDR